MFFCSPLYALAFLQQASTESRRQRCLNEFVLLFSQALPNADLHLRHHPLPNRGLMPKPLPHRSFHAILPPCLNPTSSFISHVGQFIASLVPFSFRSASSPDGSNGRRGCWVVTGGTGSRCHPNHPHPAPQNQHFCLSWGGILRNLWISWSKTSIKQIKTMIFKGSLTRRTQNDSQIGKTNTSKSLKSTSECILLKFCPHRC